ncbi:MAG: PPC domain-containing protein [Deltaproteobacteria bacterium]|nr:PPC domain-containing protein [Deltaproteobacteria bacterium]
MRKPWQWTLVLALTVFAAVNGCECEDNTVEPDSGTPRYDANFVPTDASVDGAVADAHRRDTAFRDAARPDTSPQPDAAGHDTSVQDSAAACVDDTLEENDDPSEATLLAPGTVQGRTCPDDEDWFAVTAAVGDTIDVQLLFTHAAGDLDLYLIDAQNPNPPLAESESMTDNEAVNATVATAGTYYVVVVPYAGAQNTYSLALTVTPGGPTCTDDGFENNDTQATASAVAAGSYQAVLCGGDPDFYSVSLNTGDQLTVDVQIATANENLDLQIISPTGQEVGSSTTNTQTEHAVVTAASAGDYAIRIYGVTPDDSSAYDLTVAVTPATVTCRDDGFEENDDADHASPISPGSFDGQVCASDEDWFSVTLQAGDQIAVDLDLTHANGDLNLALSSPSGQQLALSNTNTDHERVTATATAGGRHLIRVFGASAQVENAYRMVVVVTPNTTCANDSFEPNDTVPQASALSAGSYAAKICPGDADWFKLALDNGDTVTVDLTFTHASGNIDLKLFSADGGTLLASSLTTTDDEHLSYVATASGNVLAQVVGVGAAVVNTYQIEIAITPATVVCIDDPFEPNDTAATAVTLAAGTYNGKVCPNDDDYYAFNLNVGDTVSAQISFTVANGDLDLQLLNPSGAVVDSSTTASSSTETVDHVATVAGRFVLRVYGFQGDGNTYQLQLTITPATPTCRDDALEENDTIATAAALTPGQVAAQICPNDDDYYSFNLNVGDTVSAQISFTAANGDLDLQLLDPSGQVVDSSTTATGNTETVDHVAVIAGRFALRVYGYRGATNSYQLQLTVTPATPTCREDGYEDNDDQAHATLVTAGTYDGQTCAGDEDWFAINLNAGDTLDVNLLFAHANGDLDLQLRAPDGVLLRTSASTDDNEEILDYVVPNAGSYALRVRGFLGAENSYRLSIVVTPAAPVCPEDGYEENDTRATATPYLTTPIAGQICAGDYDFFSVALNVGDALTAALDFTDADGDLDLYLYDPSGNLLDWSVSVTDDELIEHTATVAGTFALRVFGVGQAENAYLLTLTVVPPTPVCPEDSHEQNDTQATATPYPGSPLTGQICADDPDWVAVSLNVGDSMRAALSFTHADGDLELAFYQQSGSFITSSTSTTDNEQIDYTATAAGTYALRIYGFLGAENSYTLTVTVVPATPTCSDDAHENNDTLATAVALPSASFGGQICSGDDDYYYLDLDAGETLVIDLQFTDADGDLELRLYDAAGTTLASSMSITDDEHISYAARLAGRYIIRIWGHLGDENSYLLNTAVTANLTCPADDPLEQNDSFSAARLAVVGTVVGIVCSGDDDYYKIEVPEGGLLRATLTFNSGEGDLDLYLYSAAQSLVDSSETTSSTEFVDGYSDSATTFYVKVVGYLGDSARYSLTLSLEQSPFYAAGPPKGCPGDDGLANTYFLTLWQMRSGEAIDGVICGTTMDWYGVALAAGDRVSADLYFAQVVGDLDLYLLEPDGTIVLQQAGEVDNEHLSYTVPSSAPGNYFVVVAGYQSAENWYQLAINVARAGGSCVDDWWEQNDSRASATAVAANSSVGAQRCSGDDDYFKVNVAASETVIGTLMFEHGETCDLDLRLEDSSGGTLDSSAGVSDLEEVTATATSAATYYFKVYSYPSTQSCPYTLDVGVYGP